MDTYRERRSSVLVLGVLLLLALVDVAAPPNAASPSVDAKALESALANTMYGIFTLSGTAA